MELKFRIQTKVLKPVPEVFDAIVNPKKLTGYFVSTSSGPMVEGSQVTWRFIDYDGEALVSVKRVVPNEGVEFEWDAADGDYHTRVKIDLKRGDDTTTIVQISESGWRETQEGLTASYSNCGGWMHMSCGLKAYLEHGIDLRAGGVCYPQDYDS